MTLYPPYVINRAMLSMIGLRCFIEVANSGSFATAARRLGLSTSAVSKAVSRLEGELGVRLLQRTTRRVSMTPEGERALHGAVGPLADLEALQSELGDGLLAPTGVLRISVPAAWGRVWLVPRLPGFMHAYPRIRLELNLADRAVDLIGDRFDLVVRTGALADSQSTVARTLFEEPMVTCAAPKYLDRKGYPRVPNDLVDHDCLDHRTELSGRPYPWRFSVDGVIENWPSSGMLLIDDGEAVARAARHGLGISQMPAFLAKDALTTGELTEVLDAFRPPAMRHTILYAARTMVSPRIRAFIDFLVEERRRNDH